MNTRRIFGIIFLCLFILGLMSVTVWGVRAYRSPLGPALQATPTIMPANNLGVSTTVPTTAPAIAPTSTCGETAVWNILVLGSDAADMRDPKGSDLTRMLRVDFPNRKVVTYAFPRDLWVDSAGLGLTNPTINATRLGMVFYEARARSANSDVRVTMIDATNATARMLATNFLVSTDHYLTIDLSQVPAMVDAIGGVPVNIPTSLRDPVTGVVFPAGQQTLGGQQFAIYARTMPDSDYARMLRTNLLLDALRDKLLDPGIWVQIPQLYTRFNGVIATDLSPEQINHLACLLQQVQTNAIIKDGVKQEWTSPGPQAGSLLWNKTNVFNQMKGLGFIP